ncbi:MAG TPA: hypothetical protein EYP79_05355 [Campylobacterales bacterium]|nr:hypothetical protein [Campylobacterales bacterium]
MISKKILSLVVVAGLTTSMMAKPNLPLGDFLKEVKKAGGEQGVFVKGVEKFPKDYFLVHSNLPFLVGLSLYNPYSSILELSKKQIKELLAIKEKTVPLVLGSSKKVKNLELKLAQNIAMDNKTAKSQYDLVEQIGRIRIDLTKAHLRCITQVREILTKSQYIKLLTYVNKMGKLQKK